MKALESIKVLDFACSVRSTCTQLLAWFGADVIERPGVGDATRQQLVDVEGLTLVFYHA